MLLQVILECHLLMNLSNEKQTSMRQLSGIVCLCRQPTKFYYDDVAEKLMTGQGVGKRNFISSKRN